MKRARFTEEQIISALRQRSGRDGRGVARFRDAGDKILRRRRILISRILSAGEPDIVDPREPPVAGIRQIAFRFALFSAPRWPNGFALYHRFIPKSLRESKSILIG